MWDTRYMYVATEKSISPTFLVCCDKEKNNLVDDTGGLGYDRLNGIRKIRPSYAKSVVYI